MIQILPYLKDPTLRELWYIPYYGQCRIKIRQPGRVCRCPRGFSAPCTARQAAMGRVCLQGRPADAMLGGPGSPTALNDGQQLELMKFRV